MVRDSYDSTKQEKLRKHCHCVYPFLGASNHLALFFNVHKKLRHTISLLNALSLIPKPFGAKCKRMDISSIPNHHWKSSRYTLCHEPSCVCCIWCSQIGRSKHLHHRSTKHVHRFNACGLRHTKVSVHSMCSSSTCNSATVHL